MSGSRAPAEVTRRQASPWRPALVGILLACGGVQPAYGQSEDALDLYSVNDLGGVGLLQTRTARFAPDGTLEVGASFINPYRRYYINWQILPWLEANFRYTDVTNRVLGEPAHPQSQDEFFSDLFNLRGGGTVLDRGLDFKIRLLSEGHVRPALAIGIQDALGTGLFGGEYIVASKRFKRLDLHLGMGWGYLGSKGFLPNPLRIFGSSFRDRDADVGLGGKISWGDYFSGRRVALFGGAEYHTRIDGLSIKLEYNGTDPELEPGNNRLNEDLPIGIGVNYRPVKWFDLSVAWERGNSLMFRTAIRTNLFSTGIPKSDPQQPQLPARPPQGDIDIVRETVDLSRAGRADLDALYRDLEAVDLEVASLKIDLQEATLRASGPADSGDWRLAAARIMLRYLPQAVQKITVHGLDQTDVQGALVISRSASAMLADNGESIPKQPTPADGAALSSMSVDGQTLAVEIASGSGSGDEGGYATLAELAGLQRVAVLRDGRVVQRRDIGLTRVADAADQVFAALEAEGLEASELRLSAGDLVIIQDERAGTELIENDTLQRLASIAGGERAMLAKSVDAGPVDRQALATKIFNDLATAGFRGYALELGQDEATIHVSKTRYIQVPRNIGWVAKIAAQHLPADIEWITVVQIEDGLEVSRVAILRSDLERHDAGRGSPEETWLHMRLESPGSTSAFSDNAVISDSAWPQFRWRIEPQLLQHIGDPSTGIYLADVYAAANVAYSPLPGLTFRASLRRHIVGNLDDITRESDSLLPHVRSDIARYLREGKTAIARLQADYVTNLGADLFFRASAGLFESMFGGVGAELLYRPVDTRWALGADLNWVKQRDYDQLLDFRSYDTVTGHVSLYYDWPAYDLRTIVRGGRYLAGDYGVTFDISRRFRSGVRVGAFATFTDASAAEFGEGSFDKGFYVTIPFESLLPVSTRGASTLLFRPLTRDGGQILSVGPRLFEIVENTDYFSVRRDWNRIFD